MTAAPIDRPFDRPFDPQCHSLLGAAALAPLAGPLGARLSA